MSAKRERFALLMAMLGTAACVAPTLRTRYGPLHPDTDVPVQFRVQAEAQFGVREVELFLFEYEVTDNDGGSWSGARRLGGRWGLVDKKTYSFPLPVTIDETFVQPGFPAASYVRYLFRVTQRFGSESSEAWSFAAGEWNFGDDPIPILVTGVGGHGLTLGRVDLCFVADRDDYTSARSMLPELHGLLFDGYQASNAQEGLLRFYWGYFYAPEMGHISSSVDGILEIPDAVKHSPTIDAGAVIHTRPLSDWSSGDYFGTEPENEGTALHETGHAVFDLDDEYASVGGHHAFPLPHHNNFDSRAAAEAYNASMGWPETDVEPIDSAEKWWRPEPSSLGCIMFQDGDDQLPDFARTCIRRVQWVYKNLITFP